MFFSEHSVYLIRTKCVCLRICLWTSVCEYSARCRATVVGRTPWLLRTVIESNYRTGDRNMSPRKQSSHGGITSARKVPPSCEKSREARFWLVSFEMCQTALTTDRQAMLVHIVNHSRLNTWRYRLYMRQNMRPLVRQYFGILDGRLFIIQAMYAMTRLAWTISQHWSLNLKSPSLSRIVFHYDNVQQNSTSRLLLYF